MPFGSDTGHMSGTAVQNGNNFTPRGTAPTALAQHKRYGPPPRAMLKRTSDRGRAAVNCDRSHRFGSALLQKAPPSAWERPTGRPAADRS